MIQSFAQRAWRKIKHDANVVWLNNPIREFVIERQRRDYLDSVKAGSLARMIIFLVPSHLRVGGGIMSIISLAQETENLRRVHGADVFVCTMPGAPALLRFTKFKNERVLVNFGRLLSRLDHGGDVLVHVPEYYLDRFLKHGAEMVRSLSNIRFRFNIMLQNVDLMPRLDDIERLKAMGPVTCTTAHLAYANEETAARLKCPIHHFSVWVSPEQYARKVFSEKLDLVVVSPDSHELRDAILRQLKESLPRYEFRVISGLTYEEYKDLIAQAKFSLTFGEGLDGYFVEPIFSGAIGCAVFNGRFFTSDFKTIPFIYESWGDLVARLPGDIARVDNQEAFNELQALQFNILAQQYSFSRYVANLESYYQKYYARDQVV